MYNVISNYMCITHLLRLSLFSNETQTRKHFSVTITLRYLIANVTRMRFKKKKLHTNPMPPAAVGSGSSIPCILPSALQRLAVSGWRRAPRQSIFPSVFSPIHPSIPFQRLLSRCTQGAAVNRVHPGCLGGGEGGVARRTSCQFIAGEIHRDR